MTTTAHPLAHIVSTGDGDTLRVLIDGDIKPITVRLCCVDAPELRQKPGGMESASRLRELLPKGAAVRIRITGKDWYRRSLAEIYRQGHSVNLKLVREGYAAIYRQYFKECAATSARYESAEAQAKVRRRAFWSQDDPVMPWDWRKVNRKGGAIATMNSKWIPEAGELVEIQHHGPDGWGKKKHPYRFLVARIMDRHCDGGWLVFPLGEQPIPATLEPGLVQILGPSERTLDARIEFGDAPRSPQLQS